MARKIRLVTWNINSVRARIHHVERFVTIYQPDILCLQETKVDDGKFPKKPFERLGLHHLAIHGQPAHHGVAIASRLPFEATDKRHWCGKKDARYIAARIADAFTVHNFYVPAGGDEPDPAANEKFAHKLQFLEEMTHWSKSLNGNNVIVGDLNVAPYEQDVWSHKQLLNVVSHTPAETDRMLALIEAGGWRDEMRTFVPASEPLYTWWSYRARDWRASNRGRRLDHIWTSPGLEGTATAMQVADTARDWEKPSDHAPVILDFEI